MRRNSSSRSSRLTSVDLARVARAACVDPQRQGAHREHQRRQRRVLDLRIEVQAGVGLAQALLVEAERAPSRAQHLAAESGYVDDHGGVLQLVLRDEVIEGQIDGGDARTPTRRVDQ